MTRPLLAAFLAAVLHAAPAFAYQAKVVGITDGDTVTVLDSAQQQHKVRLAQIDAPEHDQPYGPKSKQALSNLVFGKTIEVEPVTTDRYGRTVAQLEAGSVDVNREMVAEGAAWAYRQYLTDQSYLQTEAEAKAARRGLWALQDDQVMPPWDWRHRGKTSSGPMSTMVQAAAASDGSELCDAAAADHSQWDSRLRGGLRDVPDVRTLRRSR